MIIKKYHTVCNQWKMILFSCCWYNGQNILQHPSESNCQYLVEFLHLCDEKQ